MRTCRRLHGEFNESLVIVLHEHRSRGVRRPLFQVAGVPIAGLSRGVSVFRLVQVAADNVFVSQLVLFQRIDV